MANKQNGNVYGEGNYEATRQYNKATKKFVDSGRVEQAARDAAPKSQDEAERMQQAEQAALLRAKSKPKGPPVKEPGRPDPAVEDPKRDPREPDSVEVGVARTDRGPDSP
jgi:hypothetical protein